MLASGTEFTFTVSKSGDGLRVVTLPKLKDFKPDTDDAELAALQAALCQPLVFTVTAVDAAGATAVDAAGATAVDAAGAGAAGVAASGWAAGAAAATSTSPKSVTSSKAAAAVLVVGFFRAIVITPKLLSLSLRCPQRGR